MSLEKHGQQVIPFRFALKVGQFLGLCRQVHGNKGTCDVVPALRFEVWEFYYVWSVRFEGRSQTQIKEIGSTTMFPNQSYSNSSKGYVKNEPICVGFPKCKMYMFPMNYLCGLRAMVYTTALKEKATQLDLVDLRR